MIDRIIDYDGNGNPIYTSDIEWWEEFIGIEEEDGNIIIYGY